MGRAIDLQTSIAMKDVQLLIGSQDSKKILTIASLEIRTESRSDGVFESRAFSAAKVHFHTPRLDTRVNPTNGCKQRIFISV